MIRQVPEGTDLFTGSFDNYDIAMLVFFILALIAFFAIILWILGLPGKIAIQRHHPHAETVKLMGWAGALPLFPWIHAFIWAFHDSITIDVRRMPEEERAFVEAEIARLREEEGMPPEKVTVTRGSVSVTPAGAPPAGSQA
jgi:hypothetical protein